MLSLVKRKVMKKKVCDFNNLICIWKFSKIILSQWMSWKDFRSFVKVKRFFCLKRVWFCDKIIVYFDTQSKKHLDKIYQIIQNLLWSNNYRQQYMDDLNKDFCFKKLTFKETDPKIHLKIQESFKPYFTWFLDLEF